MTHRANVLLVFPVALSMGCAYVGRIVATGGRALTGCKLTCPEEGFVPVGGPELAPPRAAARAPLRVAFSGDTDSNPCVEGLYKLVRREEARALVVPGDLDYAHPGPHPDDWKARLERFLDEGGDPFPYFASVGNHDAKCWKDCPAGDTRCATECYPTASSTREPYEEILRKRMAGLGIPAAKGEDLGVRSSHEFRGILFVVVSPGQKVGGVEQSGEDAARFIRERLDRDASPWRIVLWHKNQTAMQACSKPNEAGFEPYEAARERGAIIATAHEHSYSRTHTMLHYERKEFDARDGVVELAAGRNFAFVSGLGGRSVRADCVNGGWFAQKHTLEDVWSGCTGCREQDAVGALFCDFEMQGEPALEAHCYFKTVGGRVIDRFTVVNHLRR